LRLYHEAAEMGHADAGYELARIFLQGYESKGIAKNPQKAQQIIDMTLAAARPIDPKSINDDNYNHAFSIEQLEGLAKAIDAVARMTSSSNSY
jgi:TPR repeat protein